MTAAAEVVWVAGVVLAGICAMTALAIAFMHYIYRPAMRIREEVRQKLIPPVPKQAPSYRIVNQPPFDQDKEPRARKKSNRR